MTRTHSVLYSAGDSLIAVDNGWAAQLVSVYHLADEFVPMARGGARVFGPPDQRYLSLASQIDRIIADFEAREKPENAAVAMLVGGNDLKQVDSPLAFQGFVKRIVKETAAQVERLTAAGIDRVIFLRLPVAYSPATLKRRDWSMVNRGLGMLNSALVAALESNPRVTIIDLDRLFADLHADPAKYGFRHFDAPPDGADDPEAYVFRDRIHHSIYVQPTIAKFVAEEYANGAPGGR